MKCWLKTTGTVSNEKRSSIQESYIMRNHINSIREFSLSTRWCVSHNSKNRGEGHETQTTGC